MSKLAVGLVIGASLASSVGSAVGDVSSGLGKIKAQSEQLKLGQSVGREYQAIEKEIGKVGEEFAKTGYKSVDLGRKLVSLEKSKYKAGQEAKKYGLNVKNLSKDMAALGVASKQAEGQIGRMEARMARAAQRSQLRGQLIGTTAMIASLGMAVRPAIAFEEAFADVRKVVEMTDEESKQFQQGLLKLSTRIPMAATALTQITAAAGQTGMTGEAALLDFTETAAKMGVAFDITAEQAGTAMAEIKNGCKISQEEVKDLGDAINHLSNNTAANAPELIEYMRRVGSVGKLAGISSEHIAALGTAFIATGVAPEVAARASNDLIMKLSSVTKQSKSVREAFQSLGYENLGKLERDMLQNPQETILGFLQKVSTKKNKLSILSATVGTGFADDIAKLVSGLDNYQEALELVGDKSQYAGSMQMEFDARAATTANSLQLLKNQLFTAANNLGSVFLPSISAGAKTLGDLISKFADFAAKNPRTVKMIGMIAASLVGLKAGSLIGRIGFSYLADGASIANGAFQMLRPSTIQAGIHLMKMRGTGSVVGGVFKTLSGGLSSFATGAIKDFKAIGAGFKALGAAAAANPIGLVLIAIAIAIGVVWYYWEPIKKAFLTFWPKLKAAWEPIGEGIKKPFQVAFGWIGEKIEWFSQKWDALKNKLGVGGAAGSTVGSASAGVQIPGHATGGIFNKPHLAAFAEGGAEEAIINISDNDNRARSIWHESGRRMGLLNESAAAPNINISVYGSPGMSPADIAMEVKRVLAAEMRKAQSRARGRFADAPVFG